MFECLVVTSESHLKVYLYQEFIMGFPARLDFFQSAAGKRGEGWTLTTCSSFGGFVPLGEGAVSIAPVSSGRVPIVRPGDHAPMVSMHE